MALLLGTGTLLWANLAPPRMSAEPDRQARQQSRHPSTPIDGSIVAQVDQAFRAAWSRSVLVPARPANELAIYRRMALALTGTIPSLAEIRRFEARPAGARLAPQLDEILADRRFADHLAERLARVFVGTEGGPFLVFRRHRFVAWLSDEIHQGRPDDQLVRRLIAGSGLWTDRPEVNFLSVAIDPAIKRPDPERLAARVARAFLGVRIDCAQCHDHPFQPWKRADFQGLAAFFGNLENSLTGLRDGKTNRYTPLDRGTGKPSSVAVVPRVPFQPDRLPAQGPPRERLAGWVTDPANPNLSLATVNRVWALLLGRPLVEPVDDLTALGEPPEPLRLLADDFTAHGYDLKRLIRVITSSRVFQLDSAIEPDGPTSAQLDTWAVFPLTRLRPEQVVGAIEQAASVETIDDNAHILVKLATSAEEREFVRRYGDLGEDELNPASGGGTIPQRLLLMNGSIVARRTRPDLFNASQRIATQAPTDRAAVEIAYLVVLTRRPDSAELTHFTARLASARTRSERQQRVSDLCWTLINATEFSWNH